MITKNTLSVTATNLKLVIKLIVFFLIVLVLLFALTVAAINPLLKVLAEALHANDFVFSEEIANGGSENLLEMLSKLGAAINTVLSSNPSQIVYTVLMLCLVFCIVKFFAGLCVLPTAKIVAGQMTSGYIDNFLTVFVANFKSTLLHSLISTLVFLIIDLPIAVFIIYMCVLIIPSLGIFAIPIGMFVFTLFYSVRLALLGQWLPRVTVSGENVWSGFTSSIRDVPYSFQRYFPGTFIIILTTVILLFTTALFTVFLSLLLIIPSAIVTLSAFSTVVYCRQIKQNYFVDTERIVEVKEDYLD